MLQKELTVERIDPRTKRTRQLLLDAFRQLLAEKTFEAITVQDITERATVNRATFYAHFEDKYILLDQSTREWIQQALHEKLPRDSHLNQANLQMLIQLVCEFLEILHTHCAPSNRNQFNSLVEQQVKQQLNTILLRWLEECEDCPTASQRQLELEATVTSWAIYGAATKWISSENKETAPAFARQVLPMISAGLGLTGWGISKLPAGKNK